MNLMEKLRQTQYKLRRYQNLLEYTHKLEEQNKQLSEDYSKLLGEFIEQYNTAQKAFKTFLEKHES
jgi:sulfur transfer protein SufE